MARRILLAIAGLSLCLHAVGIARCLTPAQDGLKFIRVARQFGHRPWTDVVRDSDQHPLYSALIATAEPVVALAIGESPESWRVAAQAVSGLAAVATLVPLYGLARSLFGQTPALLTALIYVLLPIPGAIGRDTLSDALGLLFFATTLRLGEVALRTGARRAWAATGLVSGVGYLVRPEILIAPMAVVLTGLVGRVAAMRSSRAAGPTRHAWPGLAEIGGIGVAALAIVGGYTAIKGEVTEKLSIRIASGLGPSTRPSVSPRPKMPRGLDDPRWDFAPKEESSEIQIRGSAGRTALRFVQQWAEGLGWVTLPFLAWGLWRGRTIEGSAIGRRLVGVYAALLATVAIRHATTHGYLSGRHALTLVIATVPWVGAGLWDWARGLPVRRGVGPRLARRLAVIGLSGLIALGVSTQVKAMHPSRWGHHMAGRWLVEHAGPAESVLDTRGWATFARGGPGYDYWHVRQALSDTSLSYLVVGTDELRAGSRRAATLRALLAFACEPVAEFPERPGQAAVGVRIYRFHRPESWEGMNR